MDDSWLLPAIARAAVASAPTGPWRVDVGEFWCSVHPLGAVLPGQGWKLHVSATLLSAPLVLSRVAPVLLRAGCAFKFAATPDRLATLLSARCERGSGGKFVTAYPADDARCRQLAEDLDRATGDLPGPEILSDRRWRPGSLVHCRYGVIAAEPVLTDEGALVPMLRAPDGRLEHDQRLAWFSPPAWASPLVPPPAEDGGEPGPVLLADRFEVREAIRHSYRGGVYRGVDRDGGAEVVIKQARPHVMSRLNGSDGRDLLRHEAAMLDLLAPLGAAPRRVALVDQQENLFLVEESVPGVTLRDWVSERAVTRWRGRGAPPPTAVRLAADLTGLVARVHRQGLVLCDLNPNNIMVTPQERVRLIDVEFAARAGEPGWYAGTPGYAGPDLADGPRSGPAPAPRNDLYGLGATIMYLAGGADPLLPADEPAGRPVHERLALLVRHAGRRMPAVRLLAPVILGLADGWDLPRAAAFLDRAAQAPAPGPAGSRDDDGTAVNRLLVGGLRHLATTMTPERETLWPAGEPVDPCSVQYGAAGVLAVATRAGAEAGETVATAAGWIDRRLAGVPRLLPGLYSGRSGTAWALFDAARALDDQKLADRATTLLSQVLLDLANPDVFHGNAGAGLAHLHLWRATGDALLRRRLLRCADSVLAAARPVDGHLMWPIPAASGSALAGLTNHGYAHGVAGAGAFLLYCGLATGREDCLTAAGRAGATLAATAEVWQSASRHWCNGVSGIGTFLIRLWWVTGDRRYRDLAEAAAATVHSGSWYSPAGTCHGLSGDGEFLLDMARFTGDRRYRDEAADLAGMLHARHTVRDGLTLPPDGTGVRVSASYGAGTAGAVGFLLRLRDGGHRWFMPDELLPEKPPTER